MSDHMNQAASRMKVALSAASHRVARAARGAGRRLSAEQVGQDLVEYAGMLAIVAAIIVLIVALGIPNFVSNQTKTHVQQIVTPTNPQNQGSLGN